MNKSIYYILALGAFGIITTEFGVIGILPAIKDNFNVSIDTAGWLLSGFALTVALTGPFTTALTARINRKHILAMVLAIFVISNLLSAFSTSFSMLMVARLLPALLHPVFWAVSASVAVKHAGPKDAPKALAIVMSGLSVATVLGVPITTYAADVFNWKASFYVSSLINLIAFLGIAYFVPSMPVKEKQSAQNYAAVFKNGVLWLKMGIVFITLAGMFTSYSYLAEFLGKVSHMNGTEISIILLVFGVTGIAGNWAMGIALSKNVVLTTRVFFISLIIVHLLVYQFGGFFVPAVLILSLWGFVHTGGFLAVNVNTITGLPEQQLEVVNSVLPSVYNAGITVGSLAGGYVIVHYGIQNVVWMAVPLLLLAFALTFLTQTKKVTVSPAEEEQEEVFAQQLPEPVLEVN